MSAGADQEPKQLYEFGPFRVDPEKELLLRGQETVPLTPKTFQILLVLVRRSKEVVTKDDLLKQVWPDTFVEEANLSRNIFLLRKALGESPQDHQYIVTVPGRGYRFAENVQLVPEQEISIVAASHAKVQVEVKETKTWAWLSVAAVLIAGLALGIYRLAFHQSRSLGEKGTIILADFVNSTGDPVFDGTLRQGLAVQLEQSPFLRVASDRRVQRTLQLMNKPGDASLTGPTAQEVCERAGGAAVLEGSISSLGAQYVLGLRATNCRTGEILDEEQTQVGRKEDVLTALDHMANTLRSRLGESLSTVEKYSTPLDEATTSSLEALKAYSMGLKLGFSSGFASGIPFFKRATDIDPKFAMAHAHLGLWYSSVGESVLARESIGRSYELRDRVSDPERFFITAMYQREVTGNLEAAHRALELWVQTYPRDARVHGLLAGFISQGLGRYEQSIEQANQALVLEPDFTPGYINLAFSRFYLDRFDEAESAIQSASTRKLQTAELLMLEFYIDFFKGDTAGTSRQIAMATNVPGARDWITHSESLIAARAGQLGLARNKTQQAVKQALEAGQKERAATYEAGAAVWEALFGNLSLSKRYANTALKGSQGRDVRYAAAFALALSGDYSRARVITDELAKRFPEDTSVQFNYLPSLRGFLALKSGSPAAALQILTAAVPYEFAVPSIEFNTFFGGFYPLWVRGEAYLMKREGPAAAAEFRKIVEHRGLVAGDPIGALAYLQLARSYALAGEKEQARASYRQLFDLWKDADIDCPLVRRAHVEFARL